MIVECGTADCVHYLQHQCTLTKLCDICCGGVNKTN